MSTVTEDVEEPAWPCLTLARVLTHGALLSPCRDFALNAGEGAGPRIGMAFHLGLVLPHWLRGLGMLY